MRHLTPALLLPALILTACPAPSPPVAPSTPAPSATSDPRAELERQLALCAAGIADKPQEARVSFLNDFGRALSEATPARAEAFAATLADASVEVRDAAWEAAVQAQLRRADLAAATALVAKISTPRAGDRARLALVRAATAAGRFRLAEEHALAIEDPRERQGALGELGRGLRLAEQVGPCRELLSRATESWGDEVVIQAAAALCKAGKAEEAHRIADRLLYPKDGASQGLAWGRVAALAGDLAGARKRAEAIKGDKDRHWRLRDAIAIELIQSGDLAAAEQELAGRPGGYGAAGSSQAARRLAEARAGRWDAVAANFGEGLGYWGVLERERRLVAIARERKEAEQAFLACPGLREALVFEVCEARAASGGLDAACAWAEAEGGAAGRSWAFARRLAGGGAASEPQDLDRGLLLESLARAGAVALVSERLGEGEDVGWRFPVVRGLLAWERAQR